MVEGRVGLLANIIMFIFGILYELQLRFPTDNQFFHELPHPWDRDFEEDMIPGGSQKWEMRSNGAIFDLKLLEFGE